jgi:hypothetical protein
MRIAAVTSFIVAAAYNAPLAQRPSAPVENQLPHQACAVATGRSRQVLHHLPQSAREDRRARARHAGSGGRAESRRGLGESRPEGAHGGHASFGRARPDKGDGREPRGRGSRASSIALRPSTRIRAARRCSVSTAVNIRTLCATCLRRARCLRRFCRPMWRGTGSTTTPMR